MKDMTSSKIYLNFGLLGLYAKKLEVLLRKKKSKTIFFCFTALPILIRKKKAYLGFKEKICSILQFIKISQKQKQCYFYDLTKLLTVQHITKQSLTEQVNIKERSYSDRNSGFGH